MTVDLKTAGGAGDRLSAEWAGRDVSLYLSRCQIDTPSSLVEETWRRVHELRGQLDAVVDFGAGDARFAFGGRYRSYVGYEMDQQRLPCRPLPVGARVEHRCAFTAGINNADLSIGNPPFVRNQDLPEGWRSQVAERLRARSGVRLSGLANAWQYFFLLSLLSTKDDGLCALVIPYEWVSRPSVEALRAYVREQQWHVDVYRLSDHSFETVLTTASVTIVDKSRRDGQWCFYETTADGTDRPMPSTTGAEGGHLSYARSSVRQRLPRASRGLSPGTQQVFVLTEAERGHLRLKPGRDVVRCATTLRHLPGHCRELDERTFEKAYRDAGARCWLINPEMATEPGPLRAYLDSVNPSAYATATCLDRDLWWNFLMPSTPAALVATCFKSDTPKAVLNSAGAIAVGGLAGIHNTDPARASRFLDYLAAQDLRSRIVAHANRLMKLEIGQLNTLIAEFAASDRNG
ncbi:MAG TPA: hypothetical protein VE053_01625 [Allosphingosinicella sp.]|nr:hypothetical protein [Allosphingosinicella sp.]